MTRRLYFLCSFVLLLLIVSCHKSNSGGGNSSQLPGNYKFLYVIAQVQSISQLSGGGMNEKDVSNTNYTTTQNAGTVVMTKDSISLKGVAYTATTNVKSYTYESGVLTDSISFPFTETVPPLNTSTKYDIIGSDSIYFHGGYLVSLGGASNIAQPSGGRFSFKGDTLFIISKMQQNQPSQSSGGLTVSSSASAVETVVLLKQ